MILARLKSYQRLLRLDKPIGILLLLWPTLWALWRAANGHPEPSVLIIFVIGTVLMRSAGCAINDFADRDFDGHVARTEMRPLARQEIAAWEAVALTAILALLALVIALPLNRFALLLTLPAFLIAVLYPFTKRFFAIPQAFLGVAFSFGIPMAYAAVQARIPLEAWIMLLANFFWVMAYDTEYAMVDRADDLKIGIKTSAITFGRWDVSVVMACYGIFIVLMALIGVIAHLRWPFFAGLVVAILIASYHYKLIRYRKPAQCFRAFLHNNWLGATVFVGLVLEAWLG